MNVQFKGTLEISGDRGEVLFHPEDGSDPILRLEGVKPDIKDGKLVSPLQLNLTKPTIAARPTKPVEAPPAEDKS